MADRVESLRRALALSPDNHELRLLLADALAEDGRTAEAAAEYRALAELDLLPRERLVEAGAPRSPAATSSSPPGSPTAPATPG